jgi:transposase
MKHFAGLDVSLEETAICVVDEAGAMVKEARAPSEPEALVAFLQSLGLVLERIGLEACSLSAWLHESLAAAGLPAVCVETRRAKAAWAPCRTRPTVMMPAASPRSSAPAGTGPYT